MSGAESADAATSSRLPSGYAAIWALFSDWCAVIGHRDLPADPATVIGFLTGCPAAPETHRRRVAAIDHRHTAAAHPPPGRSAAVLAALGRPTGEPTRLTAETAAAVEAALRALPSHGWTQGMFGRRDRCLLVLSQLAGVPYRHLATLTAGDVTMVDGTAMITARAVTWTLRPADDGLLCGPCAVTRWLRILNLVVTRPSSRDVGQALKKAKPGNSGAPHLCRSTRGLDDATLAVSLLPPIDQWGYVPFPVQRLTPHSLSRRVRDLLGGDLGAHRDLPVDIDDEPETPAPSPPPVPRAMYGRQDVQQAWARRRADLQELAGVNDDLADIERRADELNRRATALIENRQSGIAAT